METTRECGSCKWNDDGLCDRKGYFVDDEDHACQHWEGAKKE